ncbi:MAG TPA: ankyrin repeat domain-containing protein [Puia sp.]|nr:ankyrin repeat domain-containing protein [Puia sp.]
MLQKLLFLFSCCLLFSAWLPAQIEATSHNTDALFNAIRSGSLSELQQALDHGADANDSLDGYSALMAATLNGSPDQMKLLIQYGARVNEQTSDSITALWLAVPDYEKTKLLLDNGADPNHKVQGYGVLVKLAGMPGSLGLFHLLLSRGCILKQSAPDNYLVYNAALAGDTAILGFLLNNGFNANDTVSFGDYPINTALNFQSFPTLKMLVDHGADVNVRQWIPQGADAFMGFTPLMYAALLHDKPALMYLLTHGAEVNAKNKHGLTPLMLLEQSETDDPEMTSALIEHGAVVTEKASDGTDALYYAKQKGNTASVTLLEKYKGRQSQ